MILSPKLMPIVFNPNQNPFNESRRTQLLREYAQAVCELPRNQNPVNDSSGSRAGLINPGNPDVFKLAHSRSGPANRTIEVPVGTKLMIPHMVGIVTEGEVPSGFTLQDVVNKDQNSITSRELRVNGSEVQNLNDFIVETNEFTVNHPANNIDDVPPGNNHRAIAKGRVIIVDCDHPENFRIFWRGVLSCNGTDCLEPEYREEIEYTVNVV
ncbi:MAG: hypothetical protein ACFFG0_21820 [Candidatus Thorarchaeota archaeon]